MARDRRQQRKGRRTSGTFTLLPHSVMDAPAFMNCRPSALKLLLDLSRQLNGRNNGGLIATFSKMKERGWRSTSTLEAAKKELISAGLIEQTRQGGLAQGARVPSLYAVTWLPIDEISDKAGNNILDVAPTRVASGKWREKN